MGAALHVNQKHLTKAVNNRRKGSKW